MIGKPRARAPDRFACRLGKDREQLFSWIFLSRLLPTPDDVYRQGLVLWHSGQRTRRCQFGKVRQIGRLIRVAANAQQ